MSTVILDTITGKSTATTITIGSTPVVSASANSMTIRGEGSAQTSIQQGLAKQWVQFEGDGTVSITDSFNVGALTDTAAGDYNLSFSNNMNNVGYSMSGGGTHDGGSYAASVYVDHDTTGYATGSHQINSVDHDGSQIDAELLSCTIHGDLA
jgi:hypothetical protein